MRGSERRFLLAIVGAVLIFACLRVAWLYLKPFLLALLLAAVIEPLVQWLHQRLGIGRGVSAVLVLSGFMAVLLGGVAWVVANVTADLEQLLLVLPEAAARLGDALTGALAVVERWVEGLPHPLDDAVGLTVDYVSHALAGMARGVLSSLRGAPHFLFLVMVAGLATYFISRDRHVLWAGVLQAVPAPWRSSVVRLRDEVFGGVLGMLRAQLLLVAFTGGVTVLGFEILRVPYSWLLGLAAALLELVPVIGPAGVVLPVALGYALEGEAVTALGLAVMWVALVLARQWLEPHLLGVQLGLHPLPALIAVYAAVQLVGTAGFLLGPLALIVAKAFFAAVDGFAPPRH